MKYDEFVDVVKDTKERKPILFQLNNASPVNESVIRSCEEYYGFNLPESYKKVLTDIGGGIFGYIVIYSLSEDGNRKLMECVTKKMINDMQMLPVIDLENGDYIGFIIDDNKCTEQLAIWSHDTQTFSKLYQDFFDILVKLGLNNDWSCI